MTQFKRNKKEIPFVWAQIEESIKNVIKSEKEITLNKLSIYSTFYNKEFQYWSDWLIPMQYVILYFIIKYQ